MHHVHNYGLHPLYEDALGSDVLITIPNYSPYVTLTVHKSRIEHRPFVEHLIWMLRGNMLTYVYYKNCIYSHYIGIE